MKQEQADPEKQKPETDLSNISLSLLSPYYNTITINYTASSQRIGDFVPLYAPF
jgi:hypothetical protein